MTDTGRLMIVTAQPEKTPYSAVASAVNSRRSLTAIMLSASWDTGIAIAVSVSGIVYLKMLLTGTYAGV